MGQYPVFTPSKGRADTAKLPYCSAVFVEPQDVEAYQRKCPTFPVVYQLPESNQGISYVRNSILEFAKSAGLEWYWTLDDDLTSWWRAPKSGEMKPIQIQIQEALEEAEKFAVLNNVGIISLSMGRQWFTHKPVFLNGMLTAASLINVKHASNCQFRFGNYEDSDFTLQMLHQGHCTLRLRHLAFETIPYGGKESQIRWMETYEMRSGSKLLEYWPEEYMKTKLRRSNQEKYYVVNPSAFKHLPVHYGELPEIKIDEYSDEEYAVIVSKLSERCAR